MQNSVNMTGRLVRDPELRYTPNGKAVANFALAVNRLFGDDEADFFDVTCWGKTAETVANHLGKGRMVAITGRLQTRSYEAKDGSKRKALKSFFLFLTTRFSNCKPIMLSQPGRVVRERS